jgi:DMSO reductase anchor subunit
MRRRRAITAAHVMGRCQTQHARESAGGIHAHFAGSGRAFALLFLAPLFGVELLTAAKNPVAWPAFLFGLIGIETFALVLSTLHLGRPHRFYRAFNNLRWSPVSREVAGIAVFYNLLGAYTLLTVSALTGWLLAPATAQTLAQALGWSALVAGIAALWFMHRIYRVPARPFWNHWQVLTSFYGSILTLGALTLAVVHGITVLFAGAGFDGVSAFLVWPMLAGLALEAIGLVFHARDLKLQGGEGAASHYEQTTTFGHSYRARNLLLAVLLPAITALAHSGLDGAAGLAAWSLVVAAVMAVAAIGRMLFYALVIPTTMPGAFFWRNRGFEEHARKTGLAPCLRWAWRWIATDFANTGPRSGCRTPAGLASFFKRIHRV